MHIDKVARCARPNSANRLSPARSWLAVRTSTVRAASVRASTIAGQYRSTAPRDGPKQSKDDGVDDAQFGQVIEVELGCGGPTTTNIPASKRSHADARYTPTSASAVLRTATTTAVQFQSRHSSSLSHTTCRFALKTRRGGGGAEHPRDGDPSIDSFCQSA
jgi:hypothetical protein